MEDEVFVEESATLRALRFQTLNPLLKQQSWITDFDTLQRPEYVIELERFLSDHGLHFRFVGNAEERYRFLRRVATERFVCSSPFLREHSLYRFQDAGAMLAYLAGNVLIQWDTGAGKTVCATMVLQRLFDEDLIDIALVFATKPLIVDWARFLERWTNSVEVHLVSGSKAERRSFYHRVREQRCVLVTNYEKARFPRGGLAKGRTKGTDLDALLGLVEGRRAAFILDEAQVVGNRSTQAHKGLERLIRGSKEARVIALTATPYTSSPLTVYGVMRLIDASLVGTKADFLQEYAQGFTVWGDPIWDERRLRILGQRLSGRTHIVTKSDPDVASQFPSMVETEVVVGGLSDADRVVYDYLMERARATWDEVDVPSRLAMFMLCRLVCDTSESLLYSSSPLAQEVVEKGLVADASHSRKFQAIGQIVRDVIDAGDKVVLFTAWSNLVLPSLVRFLSAQLGHDALIEPLDNLVRIGVEGGNGGEDPPEPGGLRRWRSRTPPRSGVQRSVGSEGLIGRPPGGGRTHRGIDLSHGSRSSVPIIVYTGNLSLPERTEVVRSFNDLDGPGVLVCSDAGKQGLNIYAPYVLHVDMPYTYAALKQRRDRIHRIDSMAHGIQRCWSYAFVTEGTVEERVRELVVRRMREAAAISGVGDIQEQLSQDELRYVMFGEAS